MKAQFSSRWATSGRDAAGQQIEQHRLIQFAGRRAVTAAHLIGVDFQLRPQIDFRIAACYQAFERLRRIGVLSAVANE